MIRKSVAFAMTILTVLISVISHYASPVFAEDLSPEKYLLLTGMTQAEVEGMDPEFREYIAESLQSESIQGALPEYIPVTIDEVASINSAPQLLTGITYSVDAYQLGSTIHVYPTYEFTTAKRPRGQDCFSVELGNALEPYEYGGKLWYKEYSTGTWQSDTTLTLTANQVTLNGGSYSGNQLGTPDYNLYFKGCAHVKADVGSGTMKKIAMNYLYNPYSNNFSISWSAPFGVGISYNSSGTTYALGQVYSLSY